MQHLARLHALRQHAFVAMQGIAVTQGADDDVVAVQHVHAAVHVFQLVVSGLVAEDAPRHHRAMLRADVG